MRAPAPLAYGISAALHGAALLGLARLPELTRGEVVAVEIVEVEPPAPPPPAAALAPPRAAPAAPALAPAPAPPPPSAAPPPGAPPPARAPVRVGVSLSSTTSAGGVAVPVGNTLYGELPRTAPDPSEVTPYRADRYAPPSQLTVLPRPIGPCRPPADEYPEEARRLGFEGTVVLVVDLDERGAITGARALDDPGHGLGAAAVRSLRAHCRFEPGRRGDEPFATSIRFLFRFELP